VNARSDGIDRLWPTCNTVACIGGSAEILTGAFTVASLAKNLGLTKNEADGLFYAWQDESNRHGFGWPSSYARRYARAKTPWSKARVVASLLRLVVETKGGCLHWTGR